MYRFFHVALPLRIFLSACVVIGFFSISLFPFLASSQTSRETDRKNLLDAIIKPGVVRIISHQEGEIVIPAFDIDIENQSLIFLSKGAPTTVIVNDYIHGSGFAVHPDGYIVTNAHVVSDQTLKRVAIADVFLETVIAKTLVMTDAQSKKAEELGEEGLEKFFQKIVTLLLEKTTSRLETEIAVARPTADKKTIEEAFQNGYIAEVRDISEKFWETDRDVALLWIKETRLPVLDMADTSESVKINDTVHFYGFTENDEGDTKLPLKPISLEGTLVSKRDSQKDEFTVFGVLLESPKRASGGVIASEAGNVIGLIALGLDTALEANNQDRVSVVPTEAIKDILRKHNLAQSASLFTYRDYFLDGNKFLNDKRCKKAISSFNNSSDVHPEFSVREYVEPKIKECEAVIEKGESIDTPWQEWKAEMIEKGYYTYIVTGVLFAPFLFIGGIAFVVFLYARKKRQWAHIKKRNKETEDGGVEFLDAKSPSATKMGAQKVAGLSADTGMPKRLIVDPRLVDYIRKARAHGMNDEKIVGELQGVGWGATEISHAFERSHTGN